MRHVTSGSVVMGLATDGQWVGRPTYEESLRTTGWLATGLLISSASVIASATLDARALLSLLGILL